jgi:hypothetical protein
MNMRTARTSQFDGQDQFYFLESGHSRKVDYRAIKRRTRPMMGLKDFLHLAMAYSRRTSKLDSPRKSKAGADRTAGGIPQRSMGQDDDA